MHKRLFNEAIIDVTISPDGPILIKAGEGDADPTKPDMSFVRTVRDGKPTVYLPGSSLKGVLRAHCERLARTVQGKKNLACDPLHKDESCSAKLENKKLAGAEAYARSCFLCQLFGDTSLASHFRISDAYPVEPDKVRLEERNGVAIDRVFGSVAVGPFNYETATAGEFKTTVYVKNFTLAQLGLLSLTLRDLEQKRVRLGFAKSRGLGVVSAKVTSFVLRYPVCEIAGDNLRVLGQSNGWSVNNLYGVGRFASDDGYGFPSSDETPLPDGFSYSNDTDSFLGVKVETPPRRDLEESEQAGDGVDWHPLGRACAGKWKAEVDNVN